MATHERVGESQSDRDTVHPMVRKFHPVLSEARDGTSFASTDWNSTNPMGVMTRQPKLLQQIDGVGISQFVIEEGTDPVVLRCIAMAVRKV